MVDLGISLFTSAGILLLLALVITVLRCYSRIYIVKAFGLDDWLMLVTVILFSHYCAWVFYGRSLDQGRPEDQIPLNDISPALKAFYFAENSYLLVTTTLKLSIGAFLLRIVKSKAQTYIIYVMLFIVAAFCTTIFFMSVFQCKPISHFWEPASPGTCLRPAIVLNMCYTHSAIIATSDFTFAFLPIFLVWHLQMDRFTKISVCSLMGLGAVAGVTSVTRIPFIKSLTNSSNFFHATAELAILSAVEPGLGIIIGSAAATRPLFRTILAKYGHYIQDGSSQGPKKTSPTATSKSTTCARHSVSAGGRPSDPETGHPLDTFNVSGKEFSTVMVIEGGNKKNLCKKCTEIEDKSKMCDRCGSLLSGTGTILQVGGHVNESQEHLDPLGENAIYKDVSVKRVVEFLTKK